LPPLAEQGRIVARLEKLAAHSRRARIALDDVPELLAHARQSILAAAFRGDLTKKWRKSNETDSRWNSSTVGNVVESVKYGTAVKCRYETKGTPVLRIPNIKDGAVSQQDLKFAKLEKRELAALRLEAGDVLIIRSNGSLSLVGCAALVSNADVGFAYAGYLIRLRPRCEKVDPAFLTHIINSPIIRPQIDLAAHSTSGVNNINSEELRNLRFQLPPIGEQREIVRRLKRALARLDAAAAAHVSAVSELDQFDKSLLAQAFCGQLIRQDPKDEPAALLLTRIRFEQEAAKQENPKKNTRSQSQTVTKIIMPILELIQKEFGKKEFTFAELHTAANRDYEDLKSELFTLLRPGKDNNAPRLRQRFDAEKEIMKFTLQKL